MNEKKKWRRTKDRKIGYSFSAYSEQCSGGTIRFVARECFSILIKINVRKMGENKNCIMISMELRLHRLCRTTDDLPCRSLGCWLEWFMVNWAQNHVFKITLDSLGHNMIQLYSGFSLSLSLSYIFLKCFSLFSGSFSVKNLFFFSSSYSKMTQFLVYRVSEFLFDINICVVFADHAIKVQYVVRLHRLLYGEHEAHARRSAPNGTQ